MTHTQDTPRTLPDSQVLLTTLYAGFISQCLHPEVTSHTVEPQTVSIRLTSATSPVCAGPRCGRQGRADRTIEIYYDRRLLPENEASHNEYDEYMEYMMEEEYGTFL